MGAHERLARPPRGPASADAGGPFEQSTMRVVRILLKAAAVALALAGVLSARTAAAATVALVIASPSSDAAARYLSTQIDLPVIRRASPNARRLDRLLAEARAGWHEDLVVIVDSDRATVSVVRPADGTIGSRTLSGSAAGAPYAVALAAVELLEIVRGAPPAHAAALPEARPPSVHPRFGLEAGVVQSVATSGNMALLEPTAGIDLELFRETSPAWIALGVHASGLSPSRRDVTLLFPQGIDGRGSVEYRRDELSLRLGVGHRQGPSAVIGWWDLVLAHIRVTARGAPGSFQAYDRRTAFWLGGGAELPYTLVGGVALGTGARIGWLSPTAPFYASSPPAST